MSVTKALNSKSNIKQYSDADYPINPRQPVIVRYNVDSTASQTTVNLPWTVDTINAQESFFISVDGKVLTRGSSNDYIMSAVDSLGFSSQVTLSVALPAGLNIQAWKLGFKKESEWAQDQRFVNAYEALDEGFQGFVKTSNKIAATTTTGSPATGFFYSSILNRASMLDIGNNLKPRMGTERVIFQQLILMQDEYGPSGEVVQGILNDKFGQVRFVGSWASTVASTSGSLIQPGLVSADYLEITFYGTGLNLLFAQDNTSRPGVYAVDGGSETSLTFATSPSAVINGRGYATYNMVPVVAGLTLGVHTIKIRSNGGNGLIATGYESINESSSIKVQPGTGYVQGKRLISSSQDVSAYNSAFTNAFGSVGARGGRVLVYQYTDGTIRKDIQYVDAAQANMSSADHTNEEIIKVYYAKEFGAARSDDLSTLESSGSQTRAFTSEDGTTAMVVTGNNVSMSGSGVGVDGSGGNGIFRFTFVGTGLDIQTNNTAGGTWGTNTISIDGGASIGSFGTSPTNPLWTKIVSGLPYGTHTVTITSSTGGSQYLTMNRFRVYGPKKPTLPSGCVELADYNIAATYSANSTSGASNLGTGVLRKGFSRETTFSGTWSIALNGLAVQGHDLSSTTTGDYWQYTFFGTGFDFRFGNNATSATWQFTVDGSTNLTTLSGSPVTSSYGAGITSFTASTGTLVSSTSATVGNGISLSGLTLGIHTVKFTKTAGTGTILHNALDIITPIYSPKNNLFGIWQNTLSVGSNSLSDNRNTTPVKETSSERKAYAQAIGIVSGPTNATATMIPIPDMEVVLKTSGGIVEVGFSGSFFNTGVASYSTQLYVNGVAYSTTKVGTSAIASAVGTISDKLFIPLPAGSHVFQWYFNNAGAGTATASGVSRNIYAKET